MKKKKIVALVALLGLSLAGGATAAAFIVNGANASKNDGKVDDVVILKWGDTMNVGNISDLSPTNPIYREVSVAAPSLSEGLTNVKGVLKFKLTCGDGTKDSLEGLTIDIAEDEFGLVTPTILHTITAAAKGTPETHEIEIEAAKTYYLRFQMDSTNYSQYLGATPTAVFSGNLNITYGAKVGA